MALVVEAEAVVVHLAVLPAAAVAVQLPWVLALEAWPQVLALHLAVEVAAVVEAVDAASSCWKLAMVTARWMPLFADTVMRR